MERQPEYLEREEWAVRVSRLLELIAMQIQAVERNARAGSPRSIVAQHERLRDRYKAELDDLLSDSGLTVQLAIPRKAA